MHHHTNIGYKRPSGSENIIWTKPDTSFLLIHRVLRNFLYHYQSHLFWIFCDGCLLFYCSKCCCWSVQRHGWVKVLCWRCYTHVHCFILYNITQCDDHFCRCCCLFLTAFVCKMTQYCPVMGQKTSAVLYYLPCEDTTVHIVMIICDAPVIGFLQLLCASWHSTLPQWDKKHHLYSTTYPVRIQHYTMWW